MRMISSWFSFVRWVQCPSSSSMMLSQPPTYWLVSSSLNLRSEFFRTRSEFFRTRLSLMWWYLWLVLFEIKLQSCCNFFASFVFLLQRWCCFQVSSLGFLPICWFIVALVVFSTRSLFLHGSLILFHSFPKGLTFISLCVKCKPLTWVCFENLELIVLFNLSALLGYNSHFAFFYSKVMIFSLYFESIVVVSGKWLWSWYHDKEAFSGLLILALVVY